MPKIQTETLPAIAVAFEMVAFAPKYRIYILYARLAKLGLATSRGASAICEAERDPQVSPRPVDVNKLPT